LLSLSQVIGRRRLTRGDLALFEVAQEDAIDAARQESWRAFSPPIVEMLRRAAWPEAQGAPVEAGPSNRST
jgi:hypothetical protein